ncbi:MAG: hypothetical protein ABSF44_10880 [Candidatus Bathyarchaeia archaeon]|jgi:hypothetical protein
MENGFFSSRSEQGLGIANGLGYCGEHFEEQTINLLEFEGLPSYGIPEFQNTP